MVSIGYLCRQQWQYLQYFVKIIKLFHSSLSAFRYLRVAEFRAPLRALKLAVEVAPEISQLATLGDQIQYQWGCTRKEFEELADRNEYAGYKYIGVNPVTLQPSGAFKFLCVSVISSLNNHQE